MQVDILILLDILWHAVQSLKINSYVARSSNTAQGMKSWRKMEFGAGYVCSSLDRVLAHEVLSLKLVILLHVCHLALWIQD